MGRAVLHIIAWAIGLTLVRIDAHLYWGVWAWQSIALFIPGAALLSWFSPFNLGRGKL